jgi:hypothetical protein
VVNRGIGITAGKADLLDRVLDEELPRYAEALERLGQ